MRRNDNGLAIEFSNGFLTKRRKAHRTDDVQTLLWAKDAPNNNSAESRGQSREQALTEA